MDFETLKQSSSNFDKLTKAIEANLGTENKDQNKSTKEQHTNHHTYLTALAISQEQQTISHAPSGNHHRGKTLFRTDLAEHKYSLK